MKNTLISITLALLLLSPQGRGETAFLDLLPVHPQSDALIDTLPRDTQGVPTLPASAEWSDYLIVPFSPRDMMIDEARLDAEGKREIDYLIVTKPDVLRERGLYVSSEDIENAQRERHHGSVLVSLTEQGGERIQQLTAGMRQGIDRIAIRVRGEGVSVPVVHSNVSRHILITGLSPVEMAQLLNKSGDEISPREIYLVELRAQDIPLTSPMSDEDYTLIEHSCERSEAHGVETRELPQCSSMTELIELLEAPLDELANEQLALRIELRNQLETNKKLLYHEEKKLLACSSKDFKTFSVKQDKKIIMMHELTLIRERDGDLVIERYKLEPDTPQPRAWPEKRKGFLFWD